jgi:hypothetical protein
MCIGVLGCWSGTGWEKVVPETLCKEVRYTLSGFIHGISMGQIGLPDIQRPFVWSNAKVRDLLLVLGI